MCFKEVNSRYEVQEEVLDEDDETTQETTLDISERIVNEIREYTKTNAYPIGQYLDMEVMNKYVTWVKTKL